MLCVVYYFSSLLSWVAYGSCQDAVSLARVEKLWEVGGWGLKEWAISRWKNSRSYSQVEDARKKKKKHLKENIIQRRSLVLLV